MDGTAFFNSIIALVQKIVLLVGIVTMALGGFTFFQGFQNQDGTAKQNGLNIIIGGGGITLIAALLTQISL